MKGALVISKSFMGTVVVRGVSSYIPLTFDPREIFGKVRAPVTVTVNGYTYRSTIAAMGGPACIPLRRSNRDAAGLSAGQAVEVRIDLDTSPRVVTPPADLVSALKAVPGAWDRWRALSFTHQREHVEAIAAAKKPETRSRRIGNAVQMIAAAKRKKTSNRTAAAKRTSRSRRG